MRGLWENRFVRGLVLVALVSLAIVLLSLEDSLATASALLRVAFFLAIAFFLFLVWREKRADIEAWSDRSRRIFYGAFALAAVDIGVLIGLGASGPDALAFFLVLGACAYAAYRTWRNEHTYS